MAQHDYVISNGTGAAVRSDLNNALLAIVSQNSGATEPTTTYAYQWWADTTTGLLKIRNSANNAWITLRELDGTLTIEDGTVSAPGLAFRDDLNTGIWRPGTDQFAISTNGVERVEWGTSEVVFNDAGNNYDFRVEGDTNANLLFVDASADAVGIGSSAPQAELNVAKTGGAATVYIESDAGNNATTSILRFGGASGRSASIQGFRGASSNIHSLDFYTYNSGDSFGMRLTPTGLGIGTNNPQSLLHLETDGTALRIVRGSSIGFAYNTGTASTSPFRIQSNGGSVDLYSAAGQPITFSAGGTEKAQVDSSGRLLVGTSSARTGYSGNTPEVQIEAAKASDSVRFGLCNNSNGVQDSQILLAKTRGTSVGSNTVVQDGDTLGRIQFLGADGTDLEAAAQILAQVDGTPGNNDMPGRLVFSTTADGASSPTERMRITQGGFLKASDGGSYRDSTGLYNEFVTSSTTQAGLLLSCSSSSYTGDSLLLDVNKAAATDFYFLKGRSSYGSDWEFALRGDGNAFADGSWTGGGADYAEYFEWSDSNPDAEDRRGISVVLDGDKIREAVAGEDPIGVISGNPSVVGDAAWNKWSGKYLRDEFGTYIQEDYEVTDDDGNTVIQQRRKLNPAYDLDVEYIPREQRSEWDCVGLMGKLRIRKGQVTGSRWIKMRDISDSVEEWLVR